MKRNENNIIKLVLFVLLFGISVGYAVLTSNLNIVGSSVINNPTWNVHWSNLNVSSGSIIGSDVATAAHILTGNTEVEYVITLRIPGEYYEFTVDAVNDGSIDAMIGSFSNKVY